MFEGKYYSPYEVIGIKRSASREEVNKAYEEKLEKYCQEKDNAKLSKLLCAYEEIQQNFKEKEDYEEDQARKEDWESSIAERIDYIDKLMQVCEEKEHPFYKKLAEHLPKHLEEFQKSAAYRFDTKMAIDNFLVLPESIFEQFVGKCISKTLIFSGSREIRKILSDVCSLENPFKVLYDSIDEIGKVCLYEEWIVRTCDQYIENADNYEYYENVESRLKRAKENYLASLALEVEERSLSYQFVNREALENFDLKVKECIDEHKDGVLKRQEEIAQFMKKRGLAEDHEWIKDLQSNVGNEAAFVLLLKTYQGIDGVHKAVQKGIRLVGTLKAKFTE